MKLRLTIQKGSHWLPFFFFLLLCTQVHSGAWVHEPHKFYSELSFGFYQANKIFDRTGERLDNTTILDPSDPFSILGGLFDTTYRQYDANAYLEYGIFKNAEVIVSFPFFAYAQQDSDLGNFTAKGIRDLLFGLKYKFLAKPWGVLSTQLDVGIPTGNENKKGSVSGRQDQPIPFGDGEWDYTLHLLYSQSFYPVAAYASAQVGYRFRGKGGGVQFENEIPWSVDGGYTFTLSKDRDWFKNITAFAALRGLFNTGELDPNAAFFASLSSTGNVPYQAFIDVAPGFSLNFWKKLSWVNTFSYTLDGENTGAGWAIRSGIAYSN